MKNIIKDHNNLCELFGALASSKKLSRVTKTTQPAIDFQSTT